MRNQLRDRLSLETHRLHVVSSGDLHRVQLGPYASEVAAEPDLQRLKEQMELKPVLVRRD
jgi:cell division septation protein DedD